MEYFEAKELMEQYTWMDNKPIKDSDDFWTEYTWYYDKINDIHVFVYGDSDLYLPCDENFDWICDSYNEALEWFTNYTGCDDDYNY